MRVSISKKVRFEVFKRDSFTCQYCGAKAPDVLLHVDHIKPVSKGGDNAVINLITSCQPCNAGKSDRELSDDTVIKKQQKQLQELNERREQLDMMMDWHNSLKDLKNHELNNVIQYIESHLHAKEISGYGKKQIEKLIKKHGSLEFLALFDDAFLKYSSRVDEVERHALCINYISKCLAIKDKPEEEKKARFIRGILKNKLSYINHENALTLITSYIKQGYDVDELEGLCKKGFFKNYTHFVNWIQ